MMMKQLIMLILLGILLCVTAKAQNEKQELPYSFTHKVKGKVDIEELTSDSEKAYLKFMEEKNPHYGINHYLGQYSSFSRNMNNGEHWKDLPNGDRVWRMRLCTKYTKIKGIGIHADTLEIPEGGKLFFYSNDRQHVAGPYNTHNVIGHKQFIVNSIPGQEIWIEYFEPAAHRGKSKFHIDALLYRFVDFPYGLWNEPKDELEFINFFDKETEERIAKENSTAPLGSIRGKNTGYMDIDCLETGTWETLPNGDRLWRMGVETKVAFGMDFAMRMQIPEGGYLSFYSADNMYCSSIHIEPTNPNPNSNTFFTGNIPGNKYIIEYYEPKTFKGKGELRLLHLDLDLTRWMARR